MKEWKDYPKDMKILKMDHEEVVKELKKIAEEKLGMSWDEIMKQAAKETEEQKNKKDPISEAYKKSSVSPNKMFKDSMKQLKKLTEK